MRNPDSLTPAGNVLAYWDTAAQSVVPMVRDGRVLGSISVVRAGPGRSPKPFSSREIGLLQVFADQAVIAIENVRLFTELEARNHELTETLEQQTATADILRVISSSPTDLQPVMEAIAETPPECAGRRTRPSSGWKVRISE